MDSVVGSFSKRIIFSTRKEGDFYWAVGRYRGSNAVLKYYQKFPTREEAIQYIVDREKELRSAAFEYVPRFIRGSFEYCRCTHLKLKHRIVTFKGVNVTRDCLVVGCSCSRFYRHPINYRSKTGWKKEEEGVEKKVGSED